MSSPSGALLNYFYREIYLELYWRVTAINKKKKKLSIIHRSDAVVYATSDQDVHGLGINLSNLGPTNRVDQNKKEKEEKGCVQAVHSFITLSKATFDLLDTTTAPGCFCSLSVFTRVTQTD